MEKQIYTNCIKCNRPLKNIKTRKRGYGECCWRQHLVECKKQEHFLFDINSERIKSK